MKQSKKVVARIIILILALFTVIPGTVSQKVYAEPGGSESSQAADASKDDSNKKEEKKEEDMTPDSGKRRQKKMPIRWRSSRTVGRTGQKDRAHTVKLQS